MPFGTTVCASTIDNISYAIALANALIAISKATWYTESGKEVSDLPEISFFYGIRVTMYYNDHMPPHFHAEYNGQRALVDILKARICKGALPSRQLKLILAWTVIHQDELMQNWELSKNHEPLNRIAPLI